MHKKIICILLVSLFLNLTLDIAYCTVPISSKPFSYSELSCQAYINSPTKNFTYSASNITINVWLYIGGIEKEPNTHYIPYQDISCLYSLDGAELQNMALLSAIKSELFPSIPNNYWYSNMRINFTATLIDVSRGEHDLHFSVKPDSIHTKFIVESDNDYSAIPKSIDYINFTVAQNSNESPTITQPYEALPIAIVGVVAIIAVSFLLLCRMYRKTLSQIKPNV
jgi:hypothetical protein